MNFKIFSLDVCLDTFKILKAENIIVQDKDVSYGSELKPTSIDNCQYNILSHPK